ncbi:MAG TPA: YceI family protein [Chryseolinea sp.]
MKTQMKLFALIILGSLFSFTKPEPADWKWDSVHSKLNFSASHLMVSDVDGSFKDVEATIKTTKDDFSDAVVEVTAQVNSVSSGYDERDSHLKGEHFLDAAKYPAIAFKSTSFKKAKEANTYTVTGNVTIHGVTKPITLIAVAKTGTNPATNKTIAGFKISGTLLRKDFNVGTSVPSTVVGEEITITASCEFIKN